MLRNTLTDNRLTLFCLVDGEVTDNAFPVPTSSTTTVGELKDLIKTKIPDTFNGVDAKDLTLWRVFIPDNNQNSAITLDALDDKTQLNNPRTRLSKPFPESPDNNTYILVQRPAPARPTPSPKRHVPYDSVEKELELLMKDAWHAVNAREVEAAQRELLGPFYKMALPYGSTASSMNVAMLGMMMGKESTSSDNRTLRAIVESDIGKTTNHSVVALVGRSGSGKTATVVDLARKHFVVFFVCSSSRSKTYTEFVDRNFFTLAKDVEQMCQELPTPSSENQRIAYDSRLKTLAGDRVKLEFLARLLFLQFLFNNNAQLTPEQFFREQTSGGAVTIGELVKRLRVFESTTISDMLDLTQDNLAAQLNRQQKGLVVAVDEAQIAGNLILPRVFISPTAILTGEELFDGKGELKEIYSRGFLTPLCATLGSVRATLVLGTSLSLQEADHVCSAIGKDISFHRIIRFPSFDDQDVEHVLSNLIDTSDCTVPHEKRRKLAGRARFSVAVVRELFNLQHTSPHTKQARLEKAFDSAIDRVSLDLRNKVQDLLRRDTTGEVARLLGRMVLAFKLQGGKMWFASTTHVDFMDKALCALRAHNDGVHWVMDELLVVEVVEEVLEQSNVDIRFSEHLRQLNGIIEHLGVKSSAKRNALEPLVRQSLRRFNNWYLEDLPFLQGVELPTWCRGKKLQIDEINTAHGYGYGVADSTEADLSFLMNRPSNKLPIQQSGTRQNAAWFFSDNRYAGSLAIKFYSNDIPQTDHLKNVSSSDIRCSFLRADGARTQPLLGKIRDTFVASGVPDKIVGILRIHLEFPRVKGEPLTTHVKKDPTTSAEDVMVHIDLSNIDDFFYEGIAEMKEDVLYLKRLITYMLAK
ncbi:hypothetical protein BGX30_007983 [Mortierella sp. GBA39]|nr:hypothetical protein BGX30_007983 [Mortierella sp. GBA39]